MKNAHHIFIFLTTAFLFLILGIFVGRNQLQHIRISSLGNVVTDENDANSANNGKIDINTASQAQLQLLPGIGETLAKNIIDYREENGPFMTINDLLNVDGIGKGRLNEILDFICLSDN